MALTIGVRVLHMHVLVGQAVDDSVLTRRYTCRHGPVKSVAARVRRAHLLLGQDLGPERVTAPARIPTGSPGSTWV
jgi:hypothetical protein